MKESVLLGTKPLVDSIRHFIRDPSGVFSVWHLCECRIVQWRHDSRLLLLWNWFLASPLFSLHIKKEHYKVARRYEFYVRVARTISHEWAQRTSEILFLPLEHKIHIFEPPCNILYVSDEWQLLNALLTTCILSWTALLINGPQLHLAPHKQNQEKPTQLVSFPYLGLTHGQYIEDIARWGEDMNFMFKWQEQYLTSECSENKKFISSSHRVMFFLLYGD